MLKFFIALTRNPISLVGSAITTASAILIITLFAIELIGFLGNPYIGILAYLILPAIFLFGLLMIPIGIMRARRRAARNAAEGAGLESFPIINLNQSTTRKWVLIFLMLSVVNVVILAVATYKGVEVMDSTEFCGATCHSVMTPEYTAYRRSPHSRVKCVSCHIGPGADWFVKSKLSGAWQVASVTFDLYPRPIPTPVHDLRPARETCEQCHWPSKFVGDRLRVITRHSNDEANTELKTVLLLRVGGPQTGGRSRGIHWHVDPGIRIRYRSDETREIIYDVELTDTDGTVKLYRSGDEPASEAETSEWRVMDCIDCHNRPSHIYRLPEDEVDTALKNGEISRSLPYVRREGIRALRATYETREGARQGILAAVNGFYGENYPDLSDEQRSLVEQAGAALGDIYARNVFPSMNIEWGTYPNHIGHEATDGCFRCHDEEHETEDGDVISQDCFTCHSLLAMEEESPEILDELQP